MRGGFDYHRPRCLEEALERKASIEGARYIAGGTDLIVRMKEGRDRPSALVSLRGVPELAAISHEGATRIGAARPVADCAADTCLRGRFPALARALSLLGSPQIRSAATLGGNLCTASPCADSAPPLLVLGARLAVRRAMTDREEELPLEGFFLGPRATRLGPHDVVTAVLVDPPPEGARTAFLKKTRVAVDLALASVAVLLEFDGKICTKARVAAGSVAPTPIRLTAAERALEGEVLSSEVVERAALLARDAVRPICDQRASADYRRHVTGVLLKRAIEAAA